MIPKRALQNRAAFRACDRLLSMDYPEPTLYAAPAFIAALLVENALLKRRRVTQPTLRGYEKRDTIASFWMVLGSLVFVSLINLAIFTLSTALYRYRVTTLTGPVAYLVGFVAWDFLFYWNHRLGHRSRIVWAGHVSHHSSQYFNYATALRQPWTPVSTILIYPSLALFGVPPAVIMLSEGLNLIYQFWVHTELVGTLPRPIEWLLNTPSHHRVHHASNPRYLDKNYGGVLILWDRMFGTFEAEDPGEPVRYGITKNIETFNPLRIAFHEYVDIARDAAHPKISLRARLRAVFAPPGA